MSNEIAYQIGGFAVVLLGGIWGLKLRNKQVPKENLLANSSETFKNIETIQDNQNNLEIELKQSKELQYSLQEENVFLKGKNYNFEKQIASFQTNLNAIQSKNNDLEEQVKQDQSTIYILQNHLQNLELSQEQIKSDYQKRLQELIIENQSFSVNLRQEVAKRTDFQQQVYTLEQLQKRFSEKEQQQQQAIQKLEQKNKELNQSKMEIDQSLQQQIERLREEKLELEQFLQQQVTNAKVLQTEINQLISESRDNKLSYQQAIAESDALKQQVSFLIVDKTRLHDKVDSQTKQLIQEKIEQEQVVLDVNKLNQQISLLENDKTLLQQTLDSSQIAIAESNHNNDELKQQISLLENDITVLQQMLDSSQIAITQNNHNNDELKQQISLLENDKTVLQQMLDSSQIVIAESNHNNDELKQKLDSSENENKQDNTKSLELTAQSDELIVNIQTNQQINDSNQQIIIDTAQDITEITQTAEIQIGESSLFIQETETKEIIQPLTDINIFADKKFVILGTLTHMNREQAKNLIQEAGGSVTGSASLKTNYALVGKSPGERLKKAQKLGISQLSETQFLSLLGKNI